MALHLFFLALLVAHNGWIISHAQRQPIVFEIDGEDWTLVRDAPHCKDRVNFAIAEYWELPLYSTYREVEPDRFLVREGSDCWIELYVSGVEHVNPMFKVSEDGRVLEKKILYYWGQELGSYPKVAHAHERDQNLLERLLPPPPEQE